MKTTAEKIAVMQAFERGETIELRPKKNESAWGAICWELPVWDWATYDYRIKPADPEPQTEPRKAGEWFAHVSPSGRLDVSQHRPHDNRVVRVREVLPGDDDHKAAEIGQKWMSDSSLETWFPFSAAELNGLRAEVEKLRADRDRVWEQYNTFKRLLRERGEENDRLRETLNAIAQMAKDGAA